MNNTSDSLAINIENLTVAYREEPVLWNVSVAIKQGVLLAVVGPNGAGKSSLIKSIIGLIKPVAGHVSIFGNSAEKSRDAIAYVPQRMSVDWDFPLNVVDVVMMGRYKHIGWFKKPKKHDYDSVYEALGMVDLLPFADRHISQLSGGQQQRVFLARALVQDAQIYLLDEPFSGVDIKTEKAIIKLLKELRSQQKTIIVVHHDLQTLAEYFDAVLLLNRTAIAYGSVRQVLMPEYICAAYGERNLFVQRNK